MIKRIHTKVILPLALTLALMLNVAGTTFVCATSLLFNQDIELLAEIDGTKVTLDWSLEDNSDIAAIIVERSFNKSDYNEVYRFEDGAIGDGFTDYLLNRDMENSGVHYRIRVIDNEGKVAISDAAFVKLSSKQTLKPSVVTNGGRLQVDFNSPSLSNTVIQLMNNTGRVVSEVTVRSDYGSNRELIDVSQLSSGLYFLRIEQGGVVSTTKFFL